MVYRLAFLVSYLSRFMSLQPGDMISTGTPPGVGMGQKPRRSTSVRATGWCSASPGSASSTSW